MQINNLLVQMIRIKLWVLITMIHIIISYPNLLPL